MVSLPVVPQLSECMSCLPEVAESDAIANALGPEHKPKQCGIPHALKYRSLPSLPSLSQRPTEIVINSQAKLLQNLFRSSDSPHETAMPYYDT